MDVKITDESSEGNKEHVIRDWKNGSSWFKVPLN